MELFFEAPVLKSENNLWESTLSSHHMIPRDWAWGHEASVTYLYSSFLLCKQHLSICWDILAAWFLFFLAILVQIIRDFLCIQKGYILLVGGLMYTWDQRILVYFSTTYSLITLHKSFHWTWGSPFQTAWRAGQQAHISVWLISQELRSKYTCVKSWGYRHA